MATWRTGDNIGHGRFGVVYAARPADQDGDYEYAMKCLQIDLLQAPEAVRRFEREIEILESLDHSNVMKVIARGHRKSGVPFFIMARASGSLKDEITAGRAGDEGWAVGVFRDVLSGVAHAHAHEPSVLHRDLKPSNILICSGVPSVSDFGIAKQIDVDGTTLTRTAQELGTLRYMAPEQAANVKAAGKPADVYALGKILAYMLTGTEPTPLVADFPDVPEKFKWFIDKCCRTNPDDRFADAVQALQRFERLLEEPDVELPPLDRGRELAAAAKEAIGTDKEVEAIEALDAHLRTYDTDQQVYRQVVPLIPGPVLRRWASQSPATFRTLMTTYDTHVGLNGDLPFSYCDTVADFLSFVFGVTADLAVRRLVLARLLEVGHSHNRWHVEGVAVELLASLKTTSEVEVAVEVIDDHQHAAAWFAAAALKRPLRAPIAEALRRTLTPPASSSSDVIPF